MTVGQIVSEPLETSEYPGEKASAEWGVIGDCWSQPAFHKSLSSRVLRGTTAAHRIARALAVDPEFIVADEPISALDVSIHRRS